MLKFTTLCANKGDEPVILTCIKNGRFANLTTVSNSFVAL